MSNMPPEYPTSADFDANKVHDHVAFWHFQRKPGQGGQNMSVNLQAPDGSAVVDFDVHVISEFNTKGQAVHVLIEDKMGLLNVPVAVGVGHRLTPGGLGGPGASYKGEVRMKVVSISDWLNVALKKALA